MGDIKTRRNWTSTTSPATPRFLALNSNKFSIWNHSKVHESFSSRTLKLFELSMLEKLVNAINFLRISTMGLNFSNTRQHDLAQDFSYRLISMIYFSSNIFMHVLTICNFQEPMDVGIFKRGFQASRQLTPEFRHTPSQIMTVINR